MRLITYLQALILRGTLIPLALLPCEGLFSQCPQIIWQDEFDGTTLDLSKWSYQTGDGCDISPDLCGWGNNELQWYQSQNAEVSHGTLKITAKRENSNGRNYTSARLRTIDQGDWTYGRFEARIKLPTGRGLWPAFWMLPTDEVYGGWPQSGEIDIMELIGSEPATVHGTIHFGQPWPNNRQSGESYKLHTGQFADDFHEFAVEWEPGEIRWYVDGYLYSSKTKSNVAPDRWPFDQDFHFLLNVAVGGNWPGAPDGTTRFPQIMEVDYVRVYDANKPSVRGERRVPNRAEGVAYQLSNLPEGATINWSVPAGATIVSGQGSDRITVDWGETGGDITAVISSNCGEQQLQLNIFVEPAFVPVQALENFDDEALIDFAFSTGSLTENVDNPEANSVNASALAGRYERNGSEQFDVLVYQSDAIENGDEFVDREKKFFIDVYTDAPAGTLVLLQLENSSRATGANYPTGRHSRFEARTTKQNEWERLEFSLLDQPDGSTAGSSVDQLIFLFASNTRTRNTYYFDNFEIYGQQVATSVFRPGKTAKTLRLFPNPAGDLLNIERMEAGDWQQLRITDLSGRVIREWDPEEDTQSRLQVPVATLKSGAYLLEALSVEGVIYSARFVIP